MPTVKGCNLPDDLLYDVENQIWFKELGDGTVRIGMTAVATAMAGKLVAFTPKVWSTPAATARRFSIRSKTQRRARSWNLSMTCSAIRASNRPNPL